MAHERGRAVDGSEKVLRWTPLAERVDIHHSTVQPARMPSEQAADSRGAGPAAMAV